MQYERAKGLLAEERRELKKSLRVDKRNEPREELELICKDCGGKKGDGVRDTK